MNKQLRDGLIYWTIKPPFESDIDTPVRPWRGKLRFGDLGMWQLHQFDPKTGAISFDGDSYTLVTAKSVFPNEAEALRVYQHAIEQERLTVQAALTQLDQELGWVKSQEKVNA